MDFGARLVRVPKRSLTTSLFIKCPAGSTFGIPVARLTSIYQTNLIPFSDTPECCNSLWKTDHIKAISTLRPIAIIAVVLIIALRVVPRRKVVQNRAKHWDAIFLEPATDADGAFLVSDTGSNDEHHAI